LEVAITALRSKTNVEILEAPMILAMDGVQAQINIGAEVPVTTASFGDPLQGGSQNNFINSIQFRPTGVTMLIFPRISASGVVTMDLAIEVSSATGAALTPTINTNSITTSLIVRDGQTVAMAGIMSDQASFDRKRVPVLGSIPILGALFGQTTRTHRRLELIFFITPHVIHNLPTATELTMNFQRSLKKAYDFVEKTKTEEKDLIQKRRDQELQNQQ
jgi:general secretion pathway protein D